LTCYFYFVPDFTVHVDYWQFYNHLANAWGASDGSGSRHLV